MGIKIEQVQYGDNKLVIKGICNDGLSYKHIKQTVNRFVYYYGLKYKIVKVDTNINNKSFTLNCEIINKGNVYDFRHWIALSEENQDIDDWIAKE